MGCNPFLPSQLKVDETIEDIYAKKAARKAKIAGRKFDPFKNHNDDDADDARGAAAAADGESFIPAMLSKRILEQAREQQREGEDDPEMTGAGSGKKRSGGAGAARRGSVGAGSFFTAGDDDEEEDEEIEFDVDDDIRLDGDYVDVRDGAEHISAADASVLKRFMPDDSGQRRTLADIIMCKIAEKEQMAAGGYDGMEDEDEGGAGPGGMQGRGPPLDPKVIEVYTEVGKYLSHYKSGKLPKVLKVAPALANWEDITFLTNPETWTPHATYAVTRIFASNFNAAKAQRFFNLILLPKCRDDIFQHKRLNFHLYLALKKATYKPAGFYRGIILPLAASGDCTLREAVIFGSVISKVSIPQLHSAAALMKLASLRPFTGCISIFLRLLVNKKYTLPYIAVDTLVDHFRQFTEMDGPLPVIWHQSVLALAQRYKADLTSEQKEFIRSLVSRHHHHAISPEIKRELASAGCRGDPVSMPVPRSAAAASSASAAASSSSSAGAGAGLQGKKLSDAPAVSHKQRSGDAMDDAEY